MSFKDLLVYLDGSDRTDAVMSAAVGIAKCHQARLSGLHVVGFLLPTQTGVNPGSPDDSFAAGRALDFAWEAGLAMAQRAEESFRKQLHDAGLAGNWHCGEGMVADTAGLYARHFDMTIVGQIDSAHPPLGTRRRVPEALFLNSGRPALIVPFAGQFSSIGQKVLVGWDGSRAAARAVNDAMPFLKMAAAVEVITFQHDEIDADGLDTDPTAIVSHLAQHGLHPAAATRELREESVADALLSHATTMGADLLLIGGYGHSRLREIVLGGTTRAVLRRMTMPVLMSH
jgi:nucleotide-binding universal stress UspA family protein